MKGKVYDGVCNVGYKPTFYEKRPDQPAIEVNLLILTKKFMVNRLNYSGTNGFCSEQKFNGIQELTAQISQDKEEAIQFFKIIFIKQKSQKNRSIICKIGIFLV